MTKEETINEALQDFQYSVVLIKEHYDEFEEKYGVNTGISLEHLKTAIEALEKQIPKSKHKYMGYRCVCGEQVAKNQRYCEYCGQKLLDWSDKK